MLKPMPSAESPVTSPEMGRRRYNYYNANIINTPPPPPPPHLHPHAMLCNKRYCSPFLFNMWQIHFIVCILCFCIDRFSNSRSSHEIGRSNGNYSNQQQRGLYLELERERGCLPPGSPPSDNVLFDNQCYATTPSSSNGNSDQDQPYQQRQGNRHQHHHPVKRLIAFLSFHFQYTKEVSEDAMCVLG